MEFEDVWLEIRACSQGIVECTAIDGQAARDVPALTEVLSAAEKTGDMKRTGLWEYSRRLRSDEISPVMNALRFSDKMEDARSVSFSTNVVFKNSRYTLTVFAIKGSSQ